MPKAMYGALDKVWTLPAKRGRILLNRLSKGGPTGSFTDTGEGLLTILTGLVSRGVKGTKGISLIGI